MTTTSHLPLLGRSRWKKLCPCRTCRNAGRARNRTRQIKCADKRRARREIDTERYEEP